MKCIHSLMCQWSSCLIHHPDMLHACPVYVSAQDWVWPNTQLLTPESSIMYCELVYIMPHPLIKTETLEHTNAFYRAIHYNSLVCFMGYNAERERVQSWVVHNGSG